VGLVNEIEKGDLHTPAIAAMLERYVAPLLDQGADTLVLGCTHYPFVRDGIERVLREHARSDVTLIDTGDAVARQLGRLLEAAGLLRPSGASVLRGYTTGDSALAQAFADLLGLQPRWKRLMFRPSADFEKNAAIKFAGIEIGLYNSGSLFSTS
jgi:glutamate racemase